MTNFRNIVPLGYLIALLFQPVSVKAEPASSVSSEGVPKESLTGKVSQETNRPLNGKVSQVDSRNSRDVLRGRSGKLDTKLKAKATLQDPNVNEPEFSTQTAQNVNEPDLKRQTSSRGGSSQRNGDNNQGGKNETGGVNEPNGDNNQSGGNN